MSNGGTITARLSLQGAEQVRAELAKLGPAGAAAMRELDRAMREPTAGLKALDAASGQARGGLEQLAGRAGPAGSLLRSLGPWGLAAAAGIGAVGIAASLAMRQLREAGQIAAELTDTADRIGMSTERLQAWRFVADEAGVSVSAFEGNLEKLNGQLGRLKSEIGDGRLKPWAASLGISKADLDNVHSAEQMMLLLADRLGQVKDRATQVAAAKAFGVEESLPILRLGADRVQELMERARSLGLVLNEETVAALDAMDRKLEIAAQRIQNEMTIAVAGLSDEFASLVSFLADAVGWLNKINSIKIENPGDIAGQWVNHHLVRAFGGQGNAQWMARQMRNASDDDTMLLREQMALEDARNKPDEDGPPLRDPNAGAADAARRAREEERRLREVARIMEGLDRDEIAGRRERIRLLFGDGSAADRRQAAHSLAALDTQEREARIATLEAELTRLDALDEEAKAQLDRLRQIGEESDLAKARKRAEDERQAVAEAMRAAEDAHLDITLDLLDLASRGARTAEEKRAVELEILALAQRRQEADLRAAIEAEKEPGARGRLVEALERLPQLFAAQATAVRRQTMNPVEAWWDGQHTRGQAQEWMQGQALDALDGVNRGLIDAWRNADNAGDAFRRMGDVAVDALGRVADALLEIALQRMLIQPLAGALFGDGVSGKGLLGNFLGNMVGGIMGGRGAAPATGGGVAGGLGAAGRLVAGLPGRGRGGTVGSSGLHKVGEYGLELMDLPVGARIYDNDQSRRILLDHDARMRSSGAAGQTVQPIVNTSIRVVNQTSEPVQARIAETPEGIDVILEPMVRGVVQKMGADGTLAKAPDLAPKPRKR